MRPRLFALLALFAPLAGCNDILNANDGKTGFVAFTTYTSGPGAYRLAPLGVFYNRSDLAFIPPILENCQIARYTNTESLPSGQSLDAGERVITVLPARTDTLVPTQQIGLITYQLNSASSIPHTPGDTIQVTVSGGPGFPAAFARVKTAEAFTHDAVGVPLAGEPLTVNWSDPASPGSLMVVSLRYATQNSVGGALDEQIFCAFNDDGDGTIPSFMLAGWVNPDPGVRAVALTRIRVQEVAVRSDVRFSLTSTFDMPTPLITP